MILYLVGKSDGAIWAHILRPGAPELPWRFLEPGSPDRTARTYKSLAIARFNLVTPFPENHPEDIWKRYLDRRLRLEARMAYTPPRPPVIDRYSILATIHDAPYDLLLWEGADEDFCRRLCDGVLPVLAEYSKSRAETTARVFTRLHFPDSLKTVEIGFSHHLMGPGAGRPDQCRHGCAIGYRLLLPNENGYDAMQVQRLFARDVARMFSPHTNGFENIFYSVQRGNQWFEDPDDARVHRCLGIDGDELDELAEFLQIRTPKCNLRALAIQWLLSTVTVNAGITIDGEVDTAITDNALGPYPWKFAKEEFWFADNVVHWCRGRAVERMKRNGEPIVRKKWKDVIEVRR